MWMELQGKKATHDFLSLYNKDSSPPPSQGAYLKTHDFLRPLERAEKAAAGGIDINRTAVGPAEHVLPGGIGTYSIGHVVGLGMRAAAIKPEQATCAAVPGAAAPDQRQQRKREPDPDDGPVGFTLWEEPAAKHAAESRGAVAGRWPPATFAAPGSGAAFGSLSSSRQQGLQERKRLMESVSRSSDDDDEFVKRDGSVHLKGELTVKGDRRSSDPSTPRSKHSATEQRRRSKINDRFQILRELIPHSDQKRDKASFLLEVIEYIRFLQEKVQKYEMSYPGWNQENAWEKVYFRSIWKNARNHSQGPVDGAAEPSQVIRNGPAATGFKFSGRFDDSNIPAAPAMVSNSQNPSESDNTTADISYKMIENSPAAALRVPLQPNFYATIANGTAAAQTQQMLASDRDNFESQSHSQVDCTVSSDMVNEQEELTVDDGTISVSSIYSQGLLTSLTRALQTSGVDLSQASISVQINLGKRVNNTRATIFSTKEHEDPSSGDIALGQPRVSNCCDELKHLPKRMRTGNK